MSSESELSDATEISTIGTSNWNAMDSDNMNMNGDSDANSQDFMTASRIRETRNLILLQEVYGVVIPQRQIQPEVQAEPETTETVTTETLAVNATEPETVATSETMTV